LSWILDVVFGAVAKPTNLYIGLVVSTGFTSFSNADTAASHGWTEYTAYAEATRVQITFGAASGSSITNPTSLSFTPNASGVTLVGWFLTNTAAKSSAAGFLIAEGSFAEGTVETQAAIIQSFRLPIADRNI
jgi:hypothetical protein